jgi:N-acetylneuraminic acid mutarotase
LAVANINDNTVTILLGNGDGTFAAAASLATNSPGFVAIGDFNGDGKPDLVVPYGVLIGNGDGTFTAESPVVGCCSIAVADFNGDGKADLALAPQDASNVTVLLAAWTQAVITTVSDIWPVGPGPHLVEASYPGDGNYHSSVSGTTVLYAQPPPTTTTLAVTVAGNPVTTVALGTVVTLTATVLSGATPVTTGLVKFCDTTPTFCTDVHLLGTAQLTSAGKAVLKFRPGMGSHSYEAVFVGGNTSYALSSSSSSALNVTDSSKYSTTTAIAQEGLAGVFTLTATVTGFVYNGGLPLPTGSVSFLDTSNGNNLLGTAVLGVGFSGFDWLSSQTPVTGYQTRSVAVGDFNGDGILDLAVVNLCGTASSCSTGTVTILLGNGDGTFTAKSSPAAGYGPSSVAVGDFNGDGIPDLAVANGDDTVTILLGNGDGTFTAAPASPATGNAPQSVAVGDLNGDGKPDLAVANYDGTVTILLGNGDGTFTAKPSLVAGTSPLSVVIADFNGDGYQDLAVVNYGFLGVAPGTAMVFLGNGDGTFTAGANAVSASLCQGIAVGDFNGDGIPDLAVGTYYYNVLGSTSTVSILLGNGDGTFKAAPSLAASGSPTVGDFNGDGKADLAVSSSGGIAILSGNGDGTFTASPFSPTTAAVTALAIGDFNGDGVPDLAAVNSSGDSATVLLTQFTQTSTATATGISPVGIGTHEVDASYSGDSIYGPSVSGTTALFQPPTTTTTLAVTAAGTPVTSVASGTVVTLTATVNNGATALTKGQVNFCDATVAYCTDIHLLGTAQLTSTGTAQLKFVPGLGSHSYKAVFLATDTYKSSSSSASNLTVTGKIPTATAIEQSGSAGNYTLTATVAGTGATTEPTGMVSFLDATNGNKVLGTASLGSGISGLGWLNSQTLTTVPYPYYAAVGDFDGDGKADLAIAAQSGTVAILLGNGDGTFTPTESPDVGGPTFIAVGDFNGDGIPDLAVGSSASNGPLTILLGKGDGTFTAAPASPTMAGVTAIAIADFNGDGIPDLAAVGYDSSTYSGTLTIFLGKGDGTFTAAPSSPTMPGATGAVITAIAEGDFNGDGIPDLAVVSAANSTPGAMVVTILLGNGDGTFTTAAGSTAVSYAASIAVGDFNGDGKADLVVLSEEIGTMTILLGHGDGTFEATTTSTGRNDTESVVVGDFNGDGKADLAVLGDYRNTLLILLGSGDGTFTPATASPQTGPTPSYNSSIAIGDFNGDGTPDLVVTSEGNKTVTVLLTTSQTATATLTGVSPAGTGTHQVDASYPGDSNFSSSTSATTGLTAQPVLATIALVASATSVAAGTPVTLTATISGSANHPTPTGTVTFLNGSAILGTGSLNGSGVATLAIGTLAAGQDSVTASYGGDATYSPVVSQPVVVVVSGTVTPMVTVTPISTSIATVRALAVAIVVNGGPSDPTPTGTVTLTGGGYTSPATALSGGYATIVIPAGSMAAGADTLTVSYAPDSASSPTYTSASGTKLVTVTDPSKMTPAVTATPSAFSITTAQALTVTVTVSGGTGSPTPTGSVILTSGTFAAPPMALSGGNAAIIVPAGSLNTGRNWLLVNYTPDSAGASTYNGASGTESVLVTAAANGTQQWTWIGGSNTIGSYCQYLAVAICGQSGVYGTLGTPAAGNTPGSRENAASWTDSSGNFWLFGGLGLDANGSQGYLNDLWEFSASTNEWTWMGGGSVLNCNANGCGQPGVYGTLGVPAAGNAPGSRYWATTWADSSGNFWLFGGFGQDANGNWNELNDLWEFSPSTSEWTWMSGSSTESIYGVYGAIGTPAAAVTPGGRLGASSWTDNSGNLWLFGGSGYNTTGSSSALNNDLWEFNPSTNEWTWMSGSYNGSELGVYGTLGTPSAGNVPGSRASAASWTDSGGLLWLFGGSGYDANGTNGPLNDLWEFNPSTNQWTWMGGSSTVVSSGSQSGVYGALGTPAAGNTPGSRELVSTWTDSGGNLWLFGGGVTLPTNYYTSYDAFSDLWEFSALTNEWAWMGGTGNYDQSGVYGALGTPAAGNVPGGRVSAASWTDKSGNLWLFGGYGLDSSGTFGYLNDLWKFSPSATPTPQATSTTSLTSSQNPSTYGQTVTFTATVSSSGSAVPNGETVWFMAGRTTLGSALLSGGTASFATNALPVGSYSITAIYGGDANYSGSTSTALSQAVGKASSSTTLTSLSNPSNFTQWVTFTAAVTGQFGGTAAGSVSFRNGSVVLGTATVTGGSAVFTTSALPQGTDPITAVYSGDSNFGGSTSNSVSQVVNAAASATNEWTWMGGSSTLGSNHAQNAYGTSGVYGTPGTPAAGNIPASREHSTSWTDSSGHLWLFGGEGWGANGNFYGLLNDLWEFDPSTNEWAWMGGSSTVFSDYGQPGVYGTLGTPAAGNTPGTRCCGVSWADSSGHLWLFGGWGLDASGNQGDLNDLWEFNPSTKEWAWMGGSSTGYSSGVYGTLGVPAAGNVPRSRESAYSWTDGNGNFWLFGGASLNDLWKFNPSTQQWTWMSGSSTLSSIVGGWPGVYGTLGTPAAGNNPGTRVGAANWTDSSGHLWLFGGWGLDASGNQGYLNDLWEFNPSTNEWTWMGGNSTLICNAFGCGVQYGVYGTLGVPAPGNVPGSVFGTSWTDSSGNFWLLAAGAYDSLGSDYGYSNALWEFNPSANEWAWMGGSGAVSPPGYPYLGVYGALGAPAPGNTPGSRIGASSWTDSSGNLWLFGGWGGDSTGRFGMFNDIWEYQPLAPTAAKTTPTVTLTPSASRITTAQGLTVTVAVSGGRGIPIPTGSVTLTSGSYASTASTLSGGSASIIIPAGSLAMGRDTLTVSYTPDSASSSTYNSATNNGGVAVTVTTVDAVFRDTIGSIRLSTYASSTLSNSGGLFASDPSAAQDLSGNTFVTARDNYNSVWANVYNANTQAWSGWQFGGGIIQGVPSIAVATSGTGWIASRDTWNSYWLVSYAPGAGFGTWMPLLGIFSTDPVVTACGDGSIYLIGKDNWNSLWSGHYIPGSGFQGWQFGGGIITGKPAATCGSDNAVYVVAEDSWNSNWMVRVSGNTWGTWYFGGALTSITPRIAALGNGSEAVVILDSTGVVYSTTYTEGTANGWQPWAEIGGILSDVAPAGVGGEMYFAGKSPTGDLWWWQQTGNQWTWIGDNGVAAGALASAPK